MNEEDRGRKIRFLVKRRYGDITHLPRRRLDRALENARKSREPKSPIDRLGDALFSAGLPHHSSHEDETARLIAEYIVALEALDRGSLDSLFEEVRPRGGLFGVLPLPEDEWTEPEKFIKAEFGTADLAHWASLPHWSAEELVQLSIGVEPGFALRPQFDYQFDPETYLAISRRRTQVARAVKAGTLSDPIAPSAFVAWADEWSVDIQPGLIEAVTAVKAHRRLTGSTLPATRSVLDDANLMEDPPLSTRERQTYQRILIGMAVRGYSYDPSCARSDKPKEIADDVRFLDFEMSDETVRKKLRDSADLLSGAVRKRLHG